MHNDKTHARQLDSKAFLALPEAPIVTAMMVAANDICLLDSLLNELKVEKTKLRQSANATSIEHTLLDARTNLIMRHQWGLILEALILLKESVKNSPSISQFVASTPELKNIFDKTLPFVGSEELIRVRNNVAFHFGAKVMKSSITSLSANLPAKYSLVIDTKPFNHHWYEIADDAQTHLLSREILKIVTDKSQVQDVVTDGFMFGSWLMTLKLNVLTILLSIIENIIAPFLTASPSQ